MKQEGKIDTDLIFEAFHVMYTITKVKVFMAFFCIFIETLQRAAILISTLPISMASFSLGEKYKIGETDLSVNIAIGTLLMLPTVLLWNMILDQVGVYPIASA